MNSPRGTNSAHGGRWRHRIGFGLALLFVGTTVVAQESGQEAAREGEPNAEISFRKGSELSAADQLKQAKIYIEKIDKHVGQVKKLVKRARKEKDIIKLNCVNDKLIQIKGSRKVAKESHKALQDPKVQADAGARNHEFAKLTIAFQKVQVLVQEAEACVGEELGYVGDTDVDTDVDPDIERQGDPTVEPQPPIPVIRPPVASPTT